MDRTQDEQQEASRRNTMRMVFDGILTIVVAAVGYVAVGVRTDLIELRAQDGTLRQELSQIRERLPIEYVRSERYIADILDIKATLLRIEAKLDNKVDKR